MNTDELDYELPPERIAQYPAQNREQARLLVVRKDADVFEHHSVSDLTGLLQAGDLLVLNDTRVIPARIYGKRQDTGGKVEFLFVEPLEDNCWEAMIRTRAGLKSGDRIALEPDENLFVEVNKKLPGGRYSVRLETGCSPLELLDAIGLPPLPPYIKRPAQPTREMDLRRYQTVYARVPGAVAAPTAGLHFTDELLQNLKKQGIDETTITLHVGPGTFKPVRSPALSEHKMESERYIINPETSVCIARARQNGGRVVAVGSTVVRALETVATDHGAVAAGEGRSSIFVYPPYSFKVVSAMLTNFHLPRSTPLAMVCALAGREKIMAAYRCAIKEGYRFYSYGDAMLIL